MNFIEFQGCFRRASEGSRDFQDRFYGASGGSQIVSVSFKVLPGVSGYLREFLEIVKDFTEVFRGTETL